MVIFAVLIVIAMSFYTGHLLRERLKNPRRSIPLILMTFCTILLITASATATLVNPPLWIHIYASFGVCMAVCLSYIANQHVFLDESPAFWQSKALRFTVVMIAFIIAIDIRQGSNITGNVFIPFTEDLSHITIPYITRYALGHMTVAVLFIASVRLFVRSIRHRGLPSYIARQWMGLIAFSIAALGSIFVELYLFSAILLKKPYQYFAYGYYVCVPFIGIFLILHIFPQSMYKSILKKQDEQKIREEQAYQASVRVLWSSLIRIVPMVQHRPQLLRSERMEAELGHARYIIWTHHPRTKPVTPEQEVALILELLHSNTVLTSAGPATHVKTLLPLQKHYKAVAQILQPHLSSIQAPDLIEETQV